MDEKVRAEIRKLALQNAFEHGGKTRDKTVLAKALGLIPELRGRAGEVMAEISPIVAEINAMGADKQKAIVESDFPEMLSVETKEERGLPELEGAGGGIVTRFPPEPNGYPHIGHAKAAIINDEYVAKYGGRRILRMDDTNPENERLEYYAAIKVGLDWLGIQYDLVKNTSDDMELLLENGKKMIESNDAYVCTCKRETIGKNRREMKTCRCSEADETENGKKWEKMHGGYKPGAAIVRLRGDMSSTNTVMRDPVLFRIIVAKHPLLGGRYGVWPSYDFAVAIEDSLDGVTHAMRSKEYELRDELYYSILDRLGMRKPQVISFSRLEFRDMPVSKRIIKPLIEGGMVSWYDDPRLPTLEALKRRGITPGAVRQFILSLGFTKADTLAPFEALESFNRKAVDANSIRLHLVKEPAKIAVGGLESDSVEISNHPGSKMGSRTVPLGSHLYVPAEDIKKMTEGDSLRLIGLGNIRIDRTGNELAATYVGDDAGASLPKIQWVPHDAQELTVLIPKALFSDGSFNENSLEVASVLVEPYYSQVGDGCEIQFVRFGYCRKESQKLAIFTHR